MLLHLLLHLFVSFALFFLEFLLFFGVKQTQVKYSLLQVHFVSGLIKGNSLGVEDAIPNVELVILGYVFVLGISEQGLLNYIDLVVLLEGVLLEVSHVVVYVVLLDTYFYVRFDFLLELSVGSHELLYVFFVEILVIILLMELNSCLLQSFFTLAQQLLYVRKEMLEQCRVIHYEFLDDCSVNVLRRKLVRVALFYDFGHLRKVPRNGGCVLLDNQVVVASYVLKEVSVLLYVSENGLKLWHLFVFVIKVLFGSVDEQFNLTI